MYLIHIKYKINMKNPLSNHGYLHSSWLSNLFTDSHLVILVLFMLIMSFLPLPNPLFASSTVS